MRILCVDDDMIVRQVTGDMLRDLRHEVYEAPDAATALSWLGRPDCSIDLLITDVRMPGMSGFTLARKAAEIRPRLQVLYISGFAEGVAAPGPLLPKPCTLGQLEASISGMMN